MDQNHGGALLDVRGVSKSYDGKKKAADGVTFEVRRGEVFGFLGPNGAGKSTTLKMITGILEPDEGEVVVNGYSLRDKLVEAKMQMAFVPDNPDILLRLTGLEFLRFMADIYEVPEAQRDARVTELAQDFGMTEVLGDAMQTYSHGMRQKMMVMGALLHDPPLWILDEPMTGLDPRSSFLLKQRMQAHAAGGNAVLFSTHVLEVAEKLVDRLAIIDRGRVQFVGTLDELRRSMDSDGSLEQLFLDLTESAEQEAKLQDAAALSGEVKGA